MSDASYNLHPWSSLHDLLESLFSIAIIILLLYNFDQSLLNFVRP